MGYSMKIPAGFNPREKASNIYINGKYIRVTPYETAG